MFNFALPFVITIGGALGALYGASNVPKMSGAHTDALEVINGSHYDRDSVRDWHAAPTKA